MKEIIRLSIICLCILLASSCGKNKKVNVPYVNYNTEAPAEFGTINVPYKLEDGVKYVAVKINGLSMDMIIDTGCSMTLISLLEAQQLIKRGLLSEEDFLGTTQSSIADGSVMEDAVFNIKTLELSDGTQTIVCRDVPTQISSNIEAPVLLGNGVLDRVASFTIDNEQMVIRFKLK